MVSPEQDASKGYNTQSLLPRKFGMLDGAGHIIGYVVGSGIFISPVVVLKHTGSPGVALIIWMVAGFIRYEGNWTKLISYTGECFK